VITRPEESYRLCCVVVCDLETSRVGAPYIYDISNLRVNDGISEPKHINKGVRQGCGLSPVLFNIYIIKLYRNLK